MSHVSGLWFLRRMVLNSGLAVGFFFAAALAFAQPTPQQIQRRQMAEERALQRDAEQREQKQHQAQFEQMRQIDRQQAEDARGQAERAREQAIAAQEQLYLLQQAQQQAQEKHSGVQDQGQPVSRTATSVQQPQQATQPAQSESAVPRQWSFRNMTDLDKAGLAALGVLLVVLAFAAGIIPARLTRRRRV